MSLTLTDDDILPLHEKIIRMAIKEILQHEPMLAPIHAWYNTLTLRNRGTPFGYVTFLSRTPNRKQHDVASFSYTYTFQIGLIVTLNTPNEDDLDDKALELINIVESVLAKNRRLLGTVDLDSYSMIKRMESTKGLKSNTRHVSLTADYTNSVPYNI